MRNVRLPHPLTSFSLNKINEMQSTIFKIKTAIYNQQYQHWKFNLWNTEKHLSFQTLRFPEVCFFKQNYRIPMWIIPRCNCLSPFSAYTNQTATSKKAVTSPAMAGGGSEACAPPPWFFARLHIGLTTPCSKKTSPLMFDNNFGKCGPIFKILSPGDS